MRQSMIKRVAAAVAVILLILVSPVAAGSAEAPKGIEMTGAAQSPSGACGDFDAVALTLQSEFAAFMQSDCPEAVRLEALRQLWRLLPPVVLPENAAF
jgi:hypothetical protein